MNCNPLLPEVWENSYPYYVYLRGYALVYWVEALLCWVVSRYADVDFVLRNPQIFSSASWESAIQKKNSKSRLRPCQRQTNAKCWERMLFISTSWQRSFWYTIVISSGVLLKEINDELHGPIRP